MHTQWTTTHRYECTAGSFIRVSAPNSELGRQLTPESAVCLPDEFAHRAPSAVSSLVLSALGRCVLQVKVRRRGSDTKYVAAVLAVGTECDIGELPLSQHGSLLHVQQPSCLLQTRRPAHLQMLQSLRCAALSIDMSYTAAMLTVEDKAFWEGLAPVNFGQLPRLQDQVTVIGCALLHYEDVADPRLNLMHWLLVTQAALQSSDTTRSFL